MKVLSPTSPVAEMIAPGIGCFLMLLSPYITNPLVTQYDMILQGIHFSLETPILTFSLVPFVPLLLLPIIILSLVSLLSVVIDLRR